MATRGYIRLRGANNITPYEEFVIDSTEILRFKLEETIAGVTAAKDVSSATVKVYFRIYKSDTSAPVNVELTKTNGGSDGIVNGEAVVRAADYTAGSFYNAAVVVVETAVADANTISGYKEYIWEGVARVKVSNIETVA